jgi:hypothetical protein
MTAIFESYAGQVAPIEFHYWNSSDPFLMFNVDENLARADYYAQGYVPSFRYDGRYIQDLFTPYEAFYDFYRWAVDSLLAIPSPLRINIDQYPSSNWDSVYVSFDIVAVDSIIDDTTPDLHLAVVEERHRYAYPIGRWDYAFRDMLPDGDGEVISLQKGDSLHFDWAYLIDSVYNLDAIVTTIWVQNDPDESVENPEMRSKVLQAACAKLPDIASVEGDTPARVWLGQNAPNPFTTETAIAYNLGRASQVRLAVYSPTGRLVTVLADGQREPGSYSAMWDGRDRFGSEAASGVYYYKLDTGKVTRTGRMVLLK